MTNEYTERDIIARLDQYRMIVEDNTNLPEPEEFVIIKSLLFLPSEYGGCSREPNHENSYAYVISRDEITSKEYFPLGERKDMWIAVVNDGEITFHHVDSRLFWATQLVPTVPKLLEFAADTPIYVPKSGMLVRLRAHTYSDAKRTLNLPLSERNTLKGPMFVLHWDLNDDMVTLARHGTYGKITEFKIERALICEYKSK